MARCFRFPDSLKTATSENAQRDLPVVDVEMQGHRTSLGGVRWRKRAGEVGH